jgi:hypothetical protein
MLSMKMNLIFAMVTHLERVAVFSGSLEVVDLRFIMRKILGLYNVKWKMNPNCRLSYQC